MIDDIRKSNGERAKEALQPDFTKSKATQTEEHMTDALDTAASYVGAHKTADHFSDNKRHTPLTHDTGRTGPIDSLVDAVKPDSSKTLGDKAHEHVDNGLSAVQPEHEKGVAQKVMDTVNPQKYGTAPEHSNFSNHATTGEKPGVVASVTNAVKNTVNKVTGQGTNDCCASECGHAAK